MSNLIIVVIVVIIVIFAVKGSMSHFKGEGGCCGGGDTSKKIRPQKLTNTVAEKTMIIEGMVCDNCAAKIHNALNSMDGVSAKVNRSRGQAIVRLGRQTDDEELTRVITDLGYTVKEIHNAE